MKKNTATDVAVSQRITCKFCLKHITTQGY